MKKIYDMNEDKLILILRKVVNDLLTCYGEQNDRYIIYIYGIYIDFIYKNFEIIISSLYIHFPYEKEIIDTFLMFLNPYLSRHKNPEELLKYTQKLIQSIENILLIEV